MRRTSSVVRNENEMLETVAGKEREIFMAVHRAQREGETSGGQRAHIARSSGGGLCALEALSYLRTDQHFLTGAA